MQRAFLEWAYAKFEVDKLSQVQHFQCPACTPSMLAVAVDGNRKLYCFKSQPGCVRFMYNEMLVSHKLLLYSKFNPHLYISFKIFFDGVFLANDAEVSSFVDYIHGTTGRVS